MSQQEAIKLFDSKRIRTVWDDEQEKYYFSVVDIIEVLTDSADSTAYWRKLKQRLKAEGNETVTNCHALKMTAADGKMRLTDSANPRTYWKVLKNRLSKEGNESVTNCNQLKLQAADGKKYLDWMRKCQSVKVSKCHDKF